MNTILRDKSSTSFGSGVSNSNCSVGQIRTYKVTQGTHYGVVTQQWRYLIFTRNSFYILFPAKGIVSYRQIISSRLYVRLKVSTFV